MKYTYAYKTSDGVRHEDSMNADSRDEVFAELRKRGIKAIKVVAADGSKANGEVRGVRKRIVAVLVVLVAVAVGIVAYFGAARTGGSSESGTAFYTDQTRRQVIGDAAIIEKGIRNGWSDVFLQTKTSLKKSRYKGKKVFVEKQAPFFGGTLLNSYHTR